ncbi:MAG: ABC transporter ATP-binding protein/permease [Clostridia bacterium]|nr:ABC transporter ATP-binding protein/permease [Clostridia bacterium]
MLKLIGIKKDYPAGTGKVEALRGIDLVFRKSEFVSILGPSGCGKTTMLNIIGGLDRFTEGDLIINGKSTKNFDDRDWDTYRNHSIGFVFQSYNLIPHQSVLQNVELALTLSGVSRAERRRRALEVLDRVGLSEQIYKRPAEMSGGQMQRVAIARALVNNPDIILADEPTGALDTETSVQVMEILKEISKDRLVIMVTHNPDLAERYSTRIINMLDGRITGDSMPCTEDVAEVRAEENSKKPTMTLKTSFSLSLKNLFTKKARTLLTAFAGSIGIIGIALIYALSEGFTTYIDEVQEDALSSYPLTVEEEVVDLSTLMQTFMGISGSEAEHELDAVYVKPALYNIIESMNNVETSKNDLRAFKEFIEKEKSDPEGRLAPALSGIQYGYNITLPVYTESADGKVIYSDTQSLLQELALKYMKVDFSSMISANEEMEASGSMMSMFSPMSGGIKLWQEMLPGKNGEIINPLISEQYDLIYGAWPNDYNEVLLVVDKNHELDDITLYALGLTTEEQVGSIITAASAKSELERNDSRWTYREICSKEYRVVLPSQCYALDEKTGLYTDLRDSDTGLRLLYSNAIPLKVTGIIRPSETSESHMLTGTIAYTSLLTKHVIEKTKGSPAVTAQEESPNKDIFTGKLFRGTADTSSDEKKKESFLSYVSKLDEKGRAELYVRIMSIPDEAFIRSKVEGILGVMTREDIENAMLDSVVAEMNMPRDEVAEYLAGMPDSELDRIMSEVISGEIRAEYADTVKEQLIGIPEGQLSLMLDATLAAATKENFRAYFNTLMDFSTSTLENNLKRLGVIDLDSPSTINFYASSFENKDIIEEIIAEYNEGKDELETIKYIDYIGIMMSSITTIINTITYVLIAFVAISLIVSSIMIGVITLISVQERTKEIGILRAIGASKKDVSVMFNAETILIGLASGILGVVVTYLLCIPINAVIHALTGITTLNAYLPLPVALILISISVILTLFSGIIPSRSAAKKDPVVALRTE